MQQHYVHSLPNTRSASADKRRLCIVFRHGDERMFTEDSGELATSLEPRPLVSVQSYPFGTMPHVLTEGVAYTRKELKEKEAFKYVLFQCTAVIYV